MDRVKTTVNIDIENYNSLLADRNALSQILGGENYSYIRTYCSDIHIIKSEEINQELLTRIKELEEVYKRRDKEHSELLIEVYELREKVKGKNKTWF